MSKYLVVLLTVTILTTSSGHMDLSLRASSSQEIEPRCWAGNTILLKSLGREGFSKVFVSSLNKIKLTDNVKKKFLLQLIVCQKYSLGNPTCF